MTNLNITFSMMVSVYWLVEIWNSPQFRTQLRNGYKLLYVKYICVVIIHLFFR